jgi:hypothetical protein
MRRASIAPLLRGTGFRRSLAKPATEHSPHSEASFLPFAFVLFFTVFLFLATVFPDAGFFSFSTCGSTVSSLVGSIGTGSPRMCVSKRTPNMLGWM